MGTSSTIDWIVGIPIVVLTILITLLGLFGHKDKVMCPKCNASKLFENKCIICGALSMNSTKEEYLR